jgi:hypothetical protein
LAVLLDRNAARPGPAAPAAHRLNFIFAEQKLDALGVLADDLILARQHGGPVQLKSGELDAELLSPLECFVNLSVMQQDFSGDAAHVQAGAAEVSVFLDHQGFQAPLRGADGGHVATRPAADDRQIELGQEQPLFMSGL